MLLSNLYVQGCEMAGTALPLSQLRHTKVLVPLQNSPQAQFRSLSDFDLLLEILEPLLLDFNQVLPGVELKLCRGVSNKGAIEVYFIRFVIGLYIEKSGFRCSSTRANIAGAGSLRRRLG